MSVKIRSKGRWDTEEIMIMMMVVNFRNTIWK